ncbi:MAG: hypothetical protein ABEK50_04320 [bacterium]
MNKSAYKTIIKTVGSLPFWTGQRKLTQFLAGKPGSFWNKESPLKPIYLSQNFFGSLSDKGTSSIRQYLQKLQQANYLYHGQISEEKPYTVVKFTDEGARKYYNILVLEEDLTEPVWRLHHVAQLKTSPNSRIATGGQVIRYNETPYLSQSPPQAPLEQRIKEESTLPLLPRSNLEFDDGYYLLRNLRFRLQQGPQLIVDGETAWSSTTAKDLQDKLTHYDSTQSQVSAPNPYVIQGRLTSVEAGDDTNAWLKLELTNQDNQTLPIYVRRNQIPEQLELSEGGHYTLGPLSEYDHDQSPGEQFELKLDDDGEIRKRRL